MIQTKFKPFIFFRVIAAPLGPIQVQQHDVLRKSLTPQPAFSITTYFLIAEAYFKMTMSGFIRIKV